MDHTYLASPPLLVPDDLRLPNAPGAQPVDQHGHDDDHAHQRLLPIGVAREHEPVADHLDQRRTDDGAGGPPMPPARLAPPMTAAAITRSSYPVARLAAQRRASRR